VGVENECAIKKRHYVMLHSEPKRFKCWRMCGNVSVKCWLTTHQPTEDVFKYSELVITVMKISLISWIFSPQSFINFGYKNSPLFFFFTRADVFQVPHCWPQSNGTLQAIHACQLSLKFHETWRLYSMLFRGPFPALPIEISQPH
jgi:hypothetical protein